MLYYSVFQIFEVKNLSRWRTVLLWELTESQMIFIHVAVALHIPPLEITVRLYPIASLSLCALMSSKIQCWHLKYCHWYGWWVNDWLREFSPQRWFFWDSADAGSSDGYFLYQLRLPCISELCFANINETVLFIIVTIVHARPVPCHLAAPKD